jgi:hypothetical protein
MPKPATATPTTAKSLGALPKSARDIMHMAIAAEVTRRRTEARRLRSSAGAEWAADKARFEQELLDNQ